MFQKSVAAFLIAAILGPTLPAFAGDLVNPKLLPPAPTRFSFLHGGIAFAPPQTGQQPYNPAPQQKHLTTTGKVLKWVGIGLMGEGALTVGLGAAVASNCNSGLYSTDCSTITKGVYFGIGGASIAAGAVLLIVGLHKKE